MCRFIDLGLVFYWLLQITVNWNGRWLWFAQRLNQQRHKKEEQTEDQ